MPKENKTHAFKRSAIALLLQASLATVAVMSIQITHAAEPTAAEAKTYAIAAGPLGAALSTFATQAGVLLSFDPVVTQGKTTTGLNGSYTISQGFDALLKGSGLAAKQEADGSYALAKALLPKSAASSNMLPEVAVTADSTQDHDEAVTGQVVGYVAKRSTTATKTDTPLIETPQSISIITKDQLEVQGARSLRDAIGYTPGIGAQSNGYRDTDNVVMRGFAIDNSSIRRDGLRSPSNTFTGSQEPYGLERIDILRGAASLLYGAAEPGGIINLVTKRPTSETLHEVGVEVGSYDRRQLTADVGGRLNEDASLTYRLTFLGRKSDTFIDYVPDDRIYIAPALSWSPTSATRITLLSYYQKNKLNRQWGVPPEASILPNPNGRVSRHLYIGEPTDSREDTQKSVTLQVEHAFSDLTKFNFSLRRSIVDLDWNYVGRDTLQADLRTLTRFSVKRMERVTGWTMDSNLQTKLDTGPIEHTFVLGVDSRSSRHQRTRAYQFIDPIDIFTPVYGAQAYGDDGADGYKQTIRMTGVYLQDQMKINQRWVLLLGARHDQVKISESDYFVSDWQGERSSATTGRAGLVYLADDGVAPFVSFSQSFEPIAGLDRQGKRFKPTDGDQYEVGVRWQPQGSNTLLSASLFQLTQSNVQVPDPVDPDNYSIQSGKIRSRGLELEAKGEMARNLRLIAAYTYTDARTIKASPAQPEAEGLRQANTPYNQASLWADYQFSHWGLPGLRVGIGARYTGNTLAANADYIVPSFTVLDAMLSYEQGGWRYGLNIKNLTDKTYIAECGSGYCNYGDPQKVLLSAQYRW